MSEIAGGDQLGHPTPPADGGTPRNGGDPTKNVEALVHASERRQDDLRWVAVDRQDALRDAEAKMTEAGNSHLREIVTLRAAYDNELRAAESARIDAIRAVDVGNVASAAQVQAAQATTLAGQVASSAEAMRTQVETTRLQLQAQWAAALEPIIKDVTDLRRVQYETAGGKAQTVEGRSVDDAARGDKAGSIGMILVFVAVAAVLASLFIGLAGIAVTLILHG